MGVSFMSCGISVAILWQQNKKPTTTWVAGYIMETAGVH